MALRAKRVKKIEIKTIKGERIKKAAPALEQPFLRKKLREMCFMAVSGYGKDCFDTA